jgi:hypothetical protein
MADNTDFSPDQAYDYVYHTVHRPAFLYKLASYGIVPGNEAETAQLLAMGDKLMALSQVETSKQASAESPLSRINAQLDNLLAQHNAPNMKQAAELEIKNTAVQIAQNPVSYKAAKILKIAQLANS